MHVDDWLSLLCVLCARACLVDDSPHVLRVCENTYVWYMNMGLGRWFPSPSVWESTHVCVCPPASWVCAAATRMSPDGGLLTLLPTSSLLLSSASSSARSARFCRSSSSRASCSSSSARVSDSARASRSRPSASTRSRSSTARRTAAFSSARSFRGEGDGVGETG